MNRLQAAEQFRRAMQMFAEGLEEEKALEVATMYDPWIAERAYKAGEYFIYGENLVGDPQLYKVLQEHVSQLQWLPHITPSLYSAIGLDDRGYPMWTQPAGAHDAYNTGDVVNCDGKLYESQIDGNTVRPGTDERFWQEKQD